jgi:hypothetical protein
MRKRMKDTELKAFVSKLNQKRESILLSLLNLETKRRDAQKQLERRMRLRAKEEERKLEPDTLAQDLPVWPALERERSSPDEPGKDSLDIPDYLRRDSNEKSSTSSRCSPGEPGNKDAEAAAEIRAHISEKKKQAKDRAALKRKIKREMVKADLTGQTRRMPLEGKAALAAIAKR